MRRMVDSAAAAEARLRLQERAAARGVWVAPWDEPPEFSWADEDVPSHWLPDPDWDPDETYQTNRPV